MTEEKKYPYLDAMPWEFYQGHIFTEVGTEDVLDNPIERQRVEVIKHWVGTGKKVLDLASCWGGISNEIRENGNDVTILDMPDVIAKAKELHPKLKFLEGSVLNIPTDEQYDVIVASEIMEHILDLDRFFSEIKRVLKKDGKLIITTPNMCRTFNIFALIYGNTNGFEYFGKPIIHCRHFTPSTLFLTLHKQGFKPLMYAGTETGAGNNLEGFTDEEKEMFNKLLEKFVPEKEYRASLMCVLAEIEQ